MSPTLIFPCASDLWDKEIEDAKSIDRECVAKYGQRDRSHHHCCVQRQQQRAGYMMVEISTNIYGFCVRDTHNDGLGNMSGNGSAAFAVEWASNWHAARPTHRVVFVGYISKDRLEEWEATIAAINFEVTA